MKSGEAAAEGETPGEATEEGTESGESEAPAATRETAPEEKTEGQEWRQKPGRYALIFTSQAKGPIVCELYPDKAPKTVENFVGLAKGTKEWTDPKTGKKVKKPFYNGLIFHRVIPDFMIQGGCPLGNGRGGPGYQFEDEFDSSLRFDRPGRLAMANSGPNTNGSQFFITTGEPSHLNDLHTIFGQVVQGQEVVEAISQVDRDADDRPLKPVTIAKILIEEVKAKER
jgi:peptidyl-prolyl cis-trans isomerase A (cyclophilin A)